MYKICYVICFVLIVFYSYSVRMVKDVMIDGKVSQTITTRRLPSIHILLSKNYLHPNLSG